MQLHETISNAFVDSLPSDDIAELPTSYMYVVGLIVNVAGWSLFLFFLYQGVMSSVTQKYLALDLDAGVCDFVMKPITGSFKADYLGHWEGDPSFSYTRAKYQFFSNSLMMTNEDWWLMIHEITSDVIEPMGMLMSVSELPHNLIVWMAWSGDVVYGSHIQSFRFTGSPSVVFDRDHHRGGIGNYFGDCLVNSTANFDPATGMFSLRFDYDEYMASPVCVGVLDPAVLGYDPLYDTDFVLSYDARSLAVASTINLHLSTLDFLTRMDIPPFFFEFGGEMLEFGIYFDARFPGMKPIECTTRVSDGAPIMCMIYMNSVPVFPLFNHYGNSRNYPEMCNCSDGSGHSDACNAFNFLTGLVVFQEAIVGNYDGVKGLIAANNMSMQIINELAYRAQFAAGTLGLVNTSFTDGGYRALAYDFCAINGTNCSIVTINSYDQRFEVSEFYLELESGSCTDSIASPKFLSLADHPVAKLTEQYFQCSNTYYDVVVNSLGIATGTYSLVLPLLLLLVMTSARWVMETKGANRKYGADSRADILDSLALLLVMSRDEKLPEPGVFKTLVEEMKEQVEDGDGALDAIAMQNGIHGLRQSLALPKLAPTCRFSQKIREDPYANIELGSAKSEKQKISRVIKVAPMPVVVVEDSGGPQTFSVPASVRDKCEAVDYVGDCGDANSGESLTFTAFLYSGGKGVADFSTLILPTVTLQLHLKTEQFDIKMRPSVQPPSVYHPSIATSHFVCISFNGRVLMSRLELNEHCELCFFVDTSSYSASTASGGEASECTLCGCNIFYQ